MTELDSILKNRHPKLFELLTIARSLTEKGIDPTYKELARAAGKSETYIRTIQKRLKEAGGPCIVVRRTSGVPRGTRTHDHHHYPNKQDLTIAEEKWSKLNKKAFSHGH